jgi:NADPH:quinone reductase-like Zn-dependent oxidoreductase
MSRIVQFAEYGAPEVLQVVDAPPPAPGPTQVRIAVRAAGVNPIDWKIVAGYMRELIPLELPAGVGSDVAGVVDAVGSEVTEWAVGDEVLGRSTTGSFADLALAESSDIVRKPAGVSWEVAGSLAGAGGTAYAVLKKLGVKAGETLLIHAAAGGVGTFAVQLAKAQGVNVIGTTGEANHEYLRSLGATPVSYGDGLLERVRAAAPDGVAPFWTPPAVARFRCRSNSLATRRAFSPWSPSTRPAPASRCTSVVPAANWALPFGNSRRSPPRDASQCRSARRIR